MNKIKSPIDKFEELRIKMKGTNNEEQIVETIVLIFRILEELSADIEEIKRIQKEELHYEKENL